MAIHAQSSCTLSTITDVQAVYTYYHLASSTITVNEAPKDSINPPGASTITVISDGNNYVWSLTEPSLNIVNNVIQTAIGQLYVIECVLFSDNTYDWGPLMTSSTYAAAKAAYNLSSQALSQASAAQNATALLGGHFIYNSDWTTSKTPHSANVVQTIKVNSIDVTNDPTQWGYNVHIGSNGIKLRYNEIDRSIWTEDGINFYGSSTLTPDVSLTSTGLTLAKGGMKAGTVGQSGFIYLSTENYGSNLTINSHQASNWREVIGTKFGVDADGNLYASNAEISGKITVTSGSDLSAGLGNYSTTSDMNNAISAATDDMATQTYVSNTYATQTALTTEINQRKAQYGTSSTGASTRAKIVSCANFELVDGNELTVYFSTANTQYSNSVQLNVNSKGAKDIWVANAVTSSSNQLLWGAGAYITFKYVTVGSSSYFIVIGEPRSWYGASTTAADAAAKTDTTAITGCVICKGTKIELAMTNNNTSTSATLNIRSTGAKAIYYGNTTTRPTVDNGHSWLGSSTATFTFDGQYYRMAGQTVINGDSITTGTINSNRIDVAGIITANGIVTNTLTGGTINTNNYIRVSTENLETPISVGLSDEKQDWRVIAGTNFGVDQQGYTYAAELILNNGVTGTNLVNASKLVDKYEKILTVTEENNTNSISTNLSIHQFQENISDVEEQTQSNYIQTQLNFEPNRLAFTQNIIDNTNSTDITTIEVAHIDATNDGIFYIEKLKPNSVLFGTLELIAYNNGLGIRRRN